MRGIFLIFFLRVIQIHKNVQWSELVRSSKSNYERKLHYNIGEGKSGDSISFDVKQKQKYKEDNNKEGGSYAEFKTPSRRKTEKKINK